MSFLSHQLHTLPPSPKLTKTLNQTQSTGGPPKALLPLLYSSCILPWQPSLWPCTRLTSVKWQGPFKLNFRGHFFTPRTYHMWERDQELPSREGDNKFALTAGDWHQKATPLLSWDSDQASAVNDKKTTRRSQRLSISPAHRTILTLAFQYLLF